MVIKKGAIFAVLSIVVGIILGYIFSDVETHQMNASMSKLNFTEVFNHNCATSLLILIGGTLTMGVVSNAILFINGIAFGVVLSNISTAQIFYVFLPYSILEVSAYVLFAIISMNLSHRLWKSLRKKNIHVMFLH